MVDLFNHTPSSTTTINQVNLLAAEVEAAFTLLEQYLIVDNTFNASFTSSVGDLATNTYLKNYHPSGGKVIGFSENLYFLSSAKDAALSLVPSTDISDLAAITVANLASPSTTYTYKTDGILLSDYDFTIVNKRVIFKETPVDQLVITYNGYAYVDGTSGYNLKYNLLVINGSTQLSTTYQGNYTYEVSGTNLLDLCSDTIKDIINNNLELLPYVSVFSNNIKLPLIEATLSNTLFTFKTDATIPENSLTDVVLFIANTTLGDLIKGLYKIVYNHNHSTTEGLNVNHGDLLGLFNNTSNIQYQVTSKLNYDHPQYLNREGYIADPTVYNNSFLGDFHIGSSDSTNQYNNLVGDSNKIIFGSFSNGHKVYYDTSLNSLVIDASTDKDCLALKAEINHTLLQLNNNYVSNLKLLDDTKYLEVMLEESKPDSNLGIIKFVRRVVDPLDNTISTVDQAKIFVRYAEIGSVTVKEELNIPANSKISYGSSTSYTTSLNNTTGYLEFNGASGGIIEFKLPTKHIKVEAATVVSPIILLDNSASKISFNNNTESVTYDGSKLTFNVVNTPNFRLNGYKKGLSLDKKYWMYVSTPTGEALPENNLISQNLYVEATTNGSVHFIKNTDNIFTEGVTNLDELEKADIFAKEATFTNYKVVYNPSTTNGISLDDINSNRIFAGKDADGNISTVLKTNSKVIVANAYTPSAVGTPVINYGELLLGKVTTNGNKDTSSGFYGNVFIPVDNKLVVNGTTIFTNDITFNTNVKMTNLLTTKDIESESITSVDIEVTDTLSTKNLEVSDNGTTRLGKTEVRRDLEVTGSITQNSATGSNILNGTLRVVGKAEFLSGLSVSNSLITGVINSPAPAADEGVSFALLQSEESKLYDRVLTEVDNKLQGFINTILERTFPMYSLYFNAVDDRNPAITIGFGIWQRDLEGRSPIGVIKDTGLLSDTNIPSVAKLNQGTTFGEYSHELSEEELPEHRHSTAGLNGSGSESMIPRTGGEGTWSWSFTGASRTNTPDNSFMSSGSGENIAHNTVHPVQIVSIWKRIG